MSSEARLHSAYHPEREAERYVESLVIAECIEYFILIECGHGYVIPYLRARCPQAKIISLHIKDEYLEDGADAGWSPISRLDAEEFLENTIGDTEAVKIKLVEWRPALSLNPELYVKLARSAASFITHADANSRTAAFFASRWKKNTRRNLNFFAETARRAHALLEKTQNRDIVVCASGPSLESYILLIKKLQTAGNIIVAAVSSAVKALFARGIEPDAVIANDGGTWARFHLYEIARKTYEHYGQRPLIAASLKAALPTQFDAFPVLLFGDGTAVEAQALKDASVPCISLPARGTVTATALDFAMGWTRGKVYLCGADFSCSGVASHARPYALDVFLECSSTRFTPHYHQKWVRTLRLKDGKSYKIYAEWFEKQRPRYGERLADLANFQE
ncbi:MAG: DUF115 domain-containing protein [Spirochaetaceae bacterium]|nr:DUF115 domain-containing protein [Spirochaetaceae bacterium]